LFEAGAVVPPILPQQYASATDMIEMLQALVLMVATIFQTTVHQETKNILEVRIRLFFMRFQKFDEPMRKVDKQPTWLPSYNFMCLLNLPKTIAKFGPVRQWYKGKWLGEPYVSTVKSERLKCPLVNLHCILLRNLHCNKAIDAFHLKERRNNKEDQLPMNTKIHASDGDLQAAFLSQSPFPVCKTIEDELYSLYYGTDKKSLKRVMQRMISRQNIVPPSNSQYELFYWNFTLTDIFKTHSTWTR
jgi:hypothetical protein